MKQLIFTFAMCCFAFVSQGQSPQIISVTLDAASPVFNRPLADTPPTTLSGVGTAVSYSTFTFVAPMSGIYTFNAEDIGFDSYGFLYSTAFNPASPLTNALTGNDDNIDLEYGFSYSLIAGTTYVLVSTAFDNNDYSTYNVTITGPFTTPLPVKITSFTVRNELGNAELNWVTGSEMNNSHFNVQKSVDGKSFTTIAKINSKALLGNSHEILAYSAWDYKISSTTYYRLEQVDLDGKLNYSEIIKLINDNSELNLSIFPNPMAQDFTYSFSLSKDSKCSITLVGINGKVIQQKNELGKKGLNAIPMQIKNNPSGNYVLTLVINEKLIATSRIVKE